MAITFDATIDATRDLNKPQSRNHKCWWWMVGV